MDDLSAPPSRNAVSTFFMQLGQRYQLILGKFMKQVHVIQKEIRTQAHEKKNHFYNLRSRQTHIGKKI
jgi:hypothetical protein